MSLHDQRTALYRFFDSKDRLIYVGITNSLSRRIDQHAERKTWFADCTRLSVEHFPDRASALEAERQAVQSENPLHNIRLRARRPVAASLPPTSWKGKPLRRWYFESRRSYLAREIGLYLYPEIHCSSAVDECDSSDGEDQVEYWIDYLRRNYPDQMDAVPIYWSVRGHGGANDGVIEHAPFQAGFPFDDFLDFFTWPEDSTTGELLDWFALPVRMSRFPAFSKALGWTPAALQPTCPLESILNSRMGWNPPRRRRNGEVA